MGNPNAGMSYLQGYGRGLSMSDGPTEMQSLNKAVKADVGTLKARAAYYKRKILI